MDTNWFVHAFITILCSYAAIIHYTPQGPVSSADITVRERLDRPIVRVYQHHPGTDLPEAAHLTGATSAFMDSIAVTQRNMALLKLARKKIRADLKDKRLAMDIDTNVVRLRRRKCDHKWVLHGNSMQLLQPQLAKK